MQKLSYIIIAVLIVMLFASIRNCSDLNDNFQQNYEALNDTVNHYKNGLGTQTASIKTLQLNNKQLQELIVKKDKKLNILGKRFTAIKSIVNFKNVILVDTVRINYEDTVSCIFERCGKIKNDWFSFIYKSDQKGLKLDSLQIWNESTVVTGYKRKWFLGKQTLTTDITNSNPYLKVDKITAAEVTLPKTWHKKWYLWLAVGTIGGFFIAN